MTLNTTIPGPLAPGDSIFVDVSVQVSSGFKGISLTNYAQIQDAKDGDGKEIKDKDSTPGNGFMKGEDDDDSERVNVSPTPYGSIGDFVFYDTNNNGVQDPGEQGVNGAKVILQDENMVAIDSMITAGGGKYLFDSLSSGQYFVKFFAPGDSVFVAPNKGGDPAKDSNAGESGTPGKTNVITIDTSKPVNDTLRNNPNIDAGIYRAPLFDLALRKSLAQNQPATVMPGDMVTFHLDGEERGRDRRDTDCFERLVAGEPDFGRRLVDGRWSDCDSQRADRWSSGTG